MSYEIVIPTSGRASLAAVLDAIGPGDDVIVVDDRRDRSHPLPVSGARVLAGPARGPAAARNAGWRATRSDWVVFLDDDVVPPPGWREALAGDLAAARDAGATQGRIVVPVGPRPTDWERNVAGLQDAQWATADMAYRREALAAVGGFDERFPRAYREDADLGLRVVEAGWTIVRGVRYVVHPVGEAPASISLRKQAGNADDVLMHRLHGPGWRARAGVPKGRRPRHLAIAAAGVGALAAAPLHRRLAGALGAAWLAGTAELAWARIKPGPRTGREVATMTWTSGAMPFFATGWWLRGLLGVSDEGAPHPLPKAVLFDRDDTLIVDVPYNGDPERVEPVPGAHAALERLRAANVPIGVVSNQSGIARGLLTPDDVIAVHGRMQALLGPLGPLEYCPHGPDDGCACRKPAPGLIERAAARLGVAPSDCAVIGDIGSDVEAALAAGARPILVPTARTRPEEVAAAPEVAGDLAEALDRLGFAPPPAADRSPVASAGSTRPVDARPGEIGAVA
ncbi:HAD superfamily hydrolase (TIGR01509 family) [Solirubrobacter pauli]|uniref:D,D-heptose 1,7-bisphosphate phosphatase n=1 Tax=Solirubrobacter pauli TaxID=166793 RepID=A0A660LKP8_9ACTN|nr:HAD-IIIA family hydrolase [Solirubrobacter pauli]RKQ93901.1 HAD superfamily hydrolase (TIGR01509 family) [Solirubrobacter pauli]